MIEWMQRHKKWLITTIWISTISFIAAGMVGWGSYNFSLSGGVVAKVGQLEVTQRQLENRFRQLYAQYNTDGKMDAQKAQELGLENLALQGLIEQTLLQNLALDLGLRVSDQEVLNEIASLSYFQENGEFSPLLYKSLLQQNNLKPSEFEDDIKNDLLIKKIMGIIPFAKATKLEKSTFDFPLLIQDEVKIKTLSPKDVQVKITQEQVKEYWEKHQNNFQYPAETKIEYVLIAADSQTPSEDELKKLYEETKSKYLDKDGNQKSYKQVRSEVLEEQKFVMAEDKALREYVALKKAQEKYGKERILLEGDKSAGSEVLEIVEKGEVGEIFKPIKTQEGFVVLKILDKKPRNAKIFEDARAEAGKELQILKDKEELEKLAQTLVKKGFEGERVNVAQGEKIKGFTQEETQVLNAKILASSQKEGYVVFPKKIVVFKIIGQKLKTSSQEIQRGDEFVKFYKAQVISKEFYKYLQNQYKITTFKKEG